MNAKHKKVLLLTDIEQGIEPIIQQVTNIQRENMLTIHSCDSVIVHPFGDIMRSIISYLSRKCGRNFCCRNRG